MSTADLLARANTHRDARARTHKTGGVELSRKRTNMSLYFFTDQKENEKKKNKGNKKTHTEMKTNAVAIIIIQLVGKSTVLLEQGNNVFFKKKNKIIC